jgi:hypothetical protein
MGARLQQVSSTKRLSYSSVQNVRVANGNLGPTSSEDYFFVLNA